MATRGGAAPVRKLSTKAGVFEGAERSDGRMALTQRASKVGVKGLFGRIGKFLREVRAELRKVAWPNRRELTIYTSVVLVTTFVVAFFTGVVDLLVSSLLTLMTGLR